jgi:hypothetical protein
VVATLDDLRGDPGDAKKESFFLIKKEEPLLGVSVASLPTLLLPTLLVVDLALKLSSNSSPSPPPSSPSSSSSSSSLIISKFRTTCVLEGDGKPVVTTLNFLPPPPPTSDDDDDDVVVANTTSLSSLKPLSTAPVADADWEVVGGERAKLAGATLEVLVVVLVVVDEDNFLPALWRDLGVMFTLVLTLPPVAAVVVFGEVSDDLTPPSVKGGGLDLTAE